MPLAGRKVSESQSAAAPASLRRTGESQHLEEERTVRSVLDGTEYEIDLNPPSPASGPNPASDRQGGNDLEMLRVTIGIGPIAMTRVSVIRRATPASPGTVFAVQMYRAGPASWASLSYSAIQARCPWFEPTCAHQIVQLDALFEKANRRLGNHGWEPPMHAPRCGEGPRARDSVIFADEGRALHRQQVPPALAGPLRGVLSNASQCSGPDGRRKRYKVSGRTKQDVTEALKKKGDELIAGLSTDQGTGGRAPLATPCASAGHYCAAFVRAVTEFDASLAIPITYVSEGRRLIRKRCRAHPPPDHFATDLPRCYSLLRGRRQR